eukprot:1142540-Pelagomonas_calceolata.AAC.10
MKKLNSHLSYPDVWEKFRGRIVRLQKKHWSSRSTHISALRSSKPRDHRFLFSVGAGLQEGARRRLGLLRLERAALLLHCLAAAAAAAVAAAAAAAAAGGPAVADGVAACLMLACWQQPCWIDQGVPNQAGTGQDTGNEAG